MIASGRGDNASNIGEGSFDPINISNAAANLEGTRWIVILVLHPSFTARQFFNQWPSNLWSRGNELVDKLGGLFKVRFCKQRLFQFVIDL